MNQHCALMSLMTTLLRRLVVLSYFLPNGFDINWRKCMDDSFSGFSLSKFNGFCQPLLNTFKCCTHNVLQSSFPPSMGVPARDMFNKDVCFGSAPCHSDPPCSAHVVMWLHPLSPATRNTKFYYVSHNIL
jgi:hypothetical protein